MRRALKPSFFMKWWFVAAVLLAVGCNSERSETQGASDNDSTTGAHAGAGTTGTHSTIGFREGCFEMIMKRDTATLSIRLQDTVVTGQLQFRWAEKDHNNGTIRGHIKDSLLIAD